MYVALQIAAFELPIEPFLPFTAKKLSQILKVETPLPGARFQNIWSNSFRTANRQAGAFAKIEDEQIQNK
jgi:methionyl-tRNA synthetase